MFPTPDTLRVIPLILFPVFFLYGIAKRPVFLPISFITLWVSKLADYYPFVTDFKIELIVGLGGLLFAFCKSNWIVDGRLSLSKNLVHKYFVILMCCIFVSFLLAWNIQFSWNVKVYDFLKVIILYLMITLTINTESDLNIFIWFFLIFYVYLSYEPVFDYLNKINSAVEYYGNTYVSHVGPLSGHVALANNMNQMIPIALFLFYAARRKALKFIAAFAVVTFIVCLVGSDSRGGVVGFLMVGLLFLYFSKKSIGYYFAIVGIFALIFVMQPRMDSTMSRINDNSINARLSGLTNGAEMIIKGNLLGVGPGCYILAREHYFSYRMESHNIYGQVMGDLGIPGLIAAFLFVRQLFSYLLQIRKKLELNNCEKTSLYFITTGIVVSLIARLFVSLGSHGLYFFYWYVMAALTAAIARMVNLDGTVEMVKK